MFTVATARPLLGRSCTTDLNVETSTAKMKGSDSRSSETTEYMTSLCEAAKKTEEFKALCNTLLNKLEHIQNLNEGTQNICKKEKAFLEKIRGIVEDKLLTKLNEKLMDPKVEFDLNNLIEGLVTFISLIFRQYWTILSYQIDGLNHSYKRGFEGRVQLYPYQPVTTRPFVLMPSYVPMYAGHPMQQPEAVNWRTPAQIPVSVYQNPVQTSNVPLYVAPPLRHREAVISAEPVRYINVPPNIQRPTSSIQMGSSQHAVTKNVSEEQEKNVGWNDMRTVRNDLTTLVREVAQQKTPEEIVQEMSNCTNFSIDNLCKKTQLNKEVEPSMKFELAGTLKEPSSTPVKSESVVEVPEKPASVPLEAAVASNKISNSSSPIAQEIKMSPMQLRLNKVRQTPATKPINPKEQSFTEKHATLVQALDSVSNSTENSSKVLEQYKTSLQKLGELNEELKRERKSKTYFEQKEDNKTKQVDALTDAYLHIEEMRERNELLKALMEKAETKSPILCAKRKRETANAFIFGQTKFMEAEPTPTNNFAFIKKEYGIAESTEPVPFTVSNSNLNFFKPSFAPVKTEPNFKFVPISSDPNALMNKLQNLNLGKNEIHREPVRFTFGQKKSTPLTNNLNFNFTKAGQEPTPNKTTPFPNFNFTKANPEVLLKKNEPFSNIGFLKETPVLDQSSTFKPIKKSQKIEPIQIPLSKINSDKVRPIAKPISKQKSALKIEPENFLIQGSTPVVNSHLAPPKISIRKEFVSNIDSEPVKNLIPSGMIQPPQTEPIKTEPSTVVSNSVTQKSATTRTISSAPKKCIKSEPGIVNNKTETKPIQDVIQKAVTATSTNVSAPKELIKTEPGMVVNNAQAKPIQGLTQKPVISKSTPNKPIQNESGNSETKTVQDSPQRTIVTRSMSKSIISAQKTPIKTEPEILINNTEAKPNKDLTQKSPMTSVNLQIEPMQTTSKQKQDSNQSPNLGIISTTSQLYSQKIPVIVTTGTTLQTPSQTTELSRQASFIRRPNSSPACATAPDTDFVAAHRKKLMSNDVQSPKKPDEQTEENVVVVQKLIGRSSPSEDRPRSPFQPIDEQHIRPGGKYHFLFNFLKKQLPYGRPALLSALSHVKYENHGELSFMLKTEIASRMRKWLEKNVPCVICNSSMDPERLRVLWCDHTFHDECITKWLKTNFTCPICRTHMP